ncbi:MAG: helix-turn-helix domain-containing protein [Ferruginibacter sp.]
MTEYIYAGSATLILFIILLVAGKRKKGLPDRIFLTWLVILLVNVATFIVISRFNYPEFLAGRILVEFSEASVFLHGPVFLFYTLSLTTTSFNIGTRQTLHLVPFFIYFLILMVSIGNSTGVSNTIRQVWTIIKMISLLMYTLSVIIQLHKHRYRVESVFSNAETKYLGWLNFLAWGIISVWIISSLGLLLYNFSGFNIPQYGGLAGNLAICGLIFLIGYYGVKQEPIFNFEGREIDTILPGKIATHLEPGIGYIESNKEEIEEEVQPAEAIIQPVINDKYKKSGLNKQKSLELFEVLTNLMLTKKPYQDSELTLFSLAEQLQIHPNHLSQIINQHCQQNFFDYINEQRVNDVKDALGSNSFDKHSLLGIAYEFGFNSKASFNRAFKKFTGMTPSEYKKAAQ